MTDTVEERVDLCRCGQPLTRVLIDPSTGIATFYWCHVCDGMSYVDAAEWRERWGVQKPDASH